MTRTVLLCWEAGRGLGHVVALKAVAGALERQGWRAVLALPGDRTPEGFSFGGLTVCSAPGWGEPESTRVGGSRSSASLGDSLARIGLSSPELVRRQIADWRGLFADHSPDLIVADFAPGAVLAARDRIPCVAVGTGFTVPPADLGRFPPLNKGKPAVHDEAAITAVVNSVLEEFGSRPLEFLPQALTGDARCVRTLPLLDPYAALRKEPVLGPLLNGAILPRKEGVAEIFCYLRDGPLVKRLDDIVACLENLPARTVAFLPGLSMEGRDRLRRGGVEVVDRPAPLGEQLAKSRLVVHSGGHGVAAAALLAGVPQVVLSPDIEKWLIGGALAERGIALRFDYNRVAAEAVRSGILAALNDPVLDMQAERAAREHKEYRHRDVAAEIVEVCARLVCPGAREVKPR